MVYSHATKAGLGTHQGLYRGIHTAQNELVRVEVCATKTLLWLEFRLHSGALKETQLIRVKDVSLNSEESTGGIPASRHETCLIELDSLVAAQSGLISNFPGRVGGLKGKLLVSHVHCHKKVKSLTLASSSRLFFLPSFKLPARGRRGRAHQGVGDIAFRWLDGQVGGLRDPGQGAAAAVAFLEGRGLHVSLKGERSGEKKRCQ